MTEQDKSRDIHTTAIWRFSDLLEKNSHPVAVDLVNLLNEGKVSLAPTDVLISRDDKRSDAGLVVGVDGKTRTAQIVIIIDAEAFVYKKYQSLTRSVENILGQLGVYLEAFQKKSVSLVPLEDSEVGSFLEGAKIQVET